MQGDKMAAGRRMILLIDNYDSFVYNLARYFRELGAETRVIRNDAITPAAIHRLQPAGVVLSPGPGTPPEAGNLLDIVRGCVETFPLLGVCLGHQAIAAALGGRLRRAPLPVHGETAEIRHEGGPLFDGLPSPLRATRYHSLIVEEETLPSALRITSRSADGLLMSFAHCRLPVFGVQFHPESVLTEHGHALLLNFLKRTGLSGRLPAERDWTAPPRAVSLSASSVPLHW